MSEPSIPIEPQPRLVIRRCWQWLCHGVGVVWMDAVLLALLLTGAFFYLRTTPEFAANLPQDASDYACSAVSLLEKGQLSLNRFDHTEPPAHPFGMPLLLAPAYIIFGHFLGNGIYSILFCALGAVLAVYFIGRQVCGRVGGCLAAIFLASHHGFHDFSQKIMSEVPSIFVLALILWVLLWLANRERARGWYLAVGALVGLAYSVRAENILVLGAVGLSFLVDARGHLVKRTAWLAVGLCPWLFATGLYNRQHFGSPLRTAFSLPSGWGATRIPVLSPRYLTAKGYLRAHAYPEHSLMEGNFLAYSKAFLSQEDNTLTFAPAAVWGPNRPQHRYATLVALRFLLSALGLAWCFWEWRRQPGARILGVWFVALSLALMSFFLLFFWQEERYILRLVPFFCVLNAVGAVALIALIHRWLRVPETEAAVVVTVLTCVLVGLLTYCSVDKLVVQSDDNLMLYPAMSRASKLIESNAVVVTNWDPQRPDAYVIRGTGRTLIPLTAECPGVAFTAADEPAKLIALIRQGRPAYLLLRNPFDLHPPPPELAVLRRWNLEIETVETVTAGNGQVVGPYLCRLRLIDLPFRIQ